MIKNKRKTIIFFLVIILFFSALFLANFELLLENIEVWIWGESTIYASKYNEEMFWKISEGMTKSEVLSLLGPPLWKSGDNEKNWNYSNQKKSNYRQRIIIFDENNKVCDREIGLYLD